MSLIDDNEEKVESASKFWLPLFSTIWGLFLFYLIIIQHGYCLGAVLLPFSGYVIKRLAAPSEVMARVQVSLTQQAASTVQRNTQNATVKRFTAEEQERRRKGLIASSAREVIMRLGVIEGYIRVLEGETDPARRTVTFQAAHEQITEISAKRASGEIPPAVLALADIVDQAKSTSGHLVNLGLSEDPLNLEIVRLFNLGA